MWQGAARASPVCVDPLRRYMQAGRQTDRQDGLGGFKKRPRRREGSVGAHTLCMLARGVERTR